MKKRVGIMLILLAAGISVMSQNERDAFRYAQYSPTGTARYSSLAGSMGAFGADFSCLSAGNPAGIGLFKRFEFTLTPFLSYNNISADYNGEKINREKYKFGINNLGIVLAGFIDTVSGWKAIQFATGLNNLARYDGNSMVLGTNDGITNFFNAIANQANGTKYNSLTGFMSAAWVHYLIDTLNGNDNYFTPVHALLNQQQLRESSGYLNEYVFSLGGNYDDKLFLGATLGVPFFNYYQRTTYTESRNPFYDSLIVYDEFRSKASGINLKLGIIYQPFQYLRLGAAFHTPTFYPKVKETFQTTFEVWNIPIDSSFYDINYGEDEIGGFNYQLRTPYHAMANIAFIYKNRGFVNVDYEYVDYATSNMQSDSYNFLSENRSINQNYRGTHIIRAGGELNLSPVVLRLGYAYSSNPYSRDIEKDGSCHTISGGIGFKTKTFFADFAYMYKFTHDKDVFYEHSLLNPYTSLITNQFFALTLGWKLGKNN